MEEEGEGEEGRRGGYHGILHSELSDLGLKSLQQNIETYGEDHGLKRPK